ncbi:Transposable element P transposase, partial [Aphis craccivora]
YAVRPPHLLKGIRNNLLNKNVIFNVNGQQKEASWEDVVALYNIDSNIEYVRMLPRLTSEQVERNKIKKIKVKNAVQVLSERVSLIMSYLSSIKVLSEEAKQQTFVYCLINFLILLMETKKRSSPQPPTVKNLATTIKGFQEVYKVLHDNGIRSILLRNFNQDSLENFYGAMRAHGYRNNNPTCEMFASSYRTLLLNNLMSAHSPGSNCEEDFGEGTLTSYQSLFEMYADTQEIEEEDQEKRVADVCSSSISKDHDLTVARDYKPGNKLLLKYPNIVFSELVQNTIDIIGYNLPSICHHKKLKVELTDIITNNLNVNIIECVDHGALFPKKFISFMIKLIVNN